MKKGIDFSHWQGDFFPDMALDNGIEFVIFKGTDFFNDIPKGFVDSKARHFYNRIKDYKIPFGIYMWLKPKHNNPKEQALFYLSLYNELSPTFPPIVDFEEGPFDNKTLYILESTLETLKERTNLVPIIYSRDTIIKLFDSKKVGFLREYPYWKAWYPYKIPLLKVQYDSFPEKDLKIPNVIYPFERLYMWQFSEKGNGPKYGVLSKQICLDYLIEPQQNKKVMIIATLGLRVREEPHLSSRIIKVLPYGTIVQVLGEEKEFYKIEEGYIYKAYTRVIFD